jgi:hypothetical protein
VFTDALVFFEPPAPAVARRQGAPVSNPFKPNFRRDRYVPVGCPSAARSSLVADTGCADGYRFAKCEGESIPANAANSLKTIGFREPADDAAAAHSPSIQRDA